MNDDEYSEENNKFMARDSDQTKSFIWTAYDGIVTFHQETQIYDEPPYEIMLGFKRYMIEFYFQIKYIWEEFKKVKAEEVEEYRKIIRKPIQDFKKQDYDKIRDFAESFMYKSGLKNIVFKKDNPGESVKKNR